VRDDFSDEIKRVLAERVNYLCSKCRAGTAGPRVDEQKSLSIGVAAHITAAAQGGPRYDPDLTSERRRHASNGIWLCQNCAKLIDNDTSRFTVAAIRDWKSKGEALARVEVGRPVQGADQPPSNEELDLLLGAGEEGELFAIRPGNAPPFISTHGGTFPSGRDLNEETSTHYMEALRSLCHEGLVHYESGCRYQLTGAGFRFARALRAALKEQHDNLNA